MRVRYCYLTLDDDRTNSHKFWEAIHAVMPDGTGRLVVRFGRKGTVGQKRVQDGVDPSVYVNKKHDKIRSGGYTAQVEVDRDATPSDLELLGVTGGLSLEGDPFAIFKQRAQDAIQAWSGKGTPVHENFNQLKADFVALETSYLQAQGYMEMAEDIYKIKLEA